MPIEFLKDVTVNGDVNIPEYINHIGDPHTKLGFVANGNFAVFTPYGNNTSAERFRITNGGYVGILNKNPKTALDVAGTATVQNNLHVVKGSLGVKTEFPQHPLHVRGAGYLEGGIFLGGQSQYNLLDDYEEGFWNPVIGIYDFLKGTTTKYETEKRASNQYTKIGNVVYCQFILEWEGSFPWYSSNTNAFMIDHSSLPFDPNGRVSSLTGTYNTINSNGIYNRSTNTLATPSLFPYRSGSGSAMHVGFFAKKGPVQNFETATTDALTIGKSEKFTITGSFAYHLGTWEELM